jgi:hypothetical protein
MIANIMDMLFGCWHTNYSFPITQKRGQRRNPAAQATGTYIVCLDCGKEFAYDWKTMKVVNPQREQKPMELEPVMVESTGPLASKQAA